MEAPRLDEGRAPLGRVNGFLLRSLPRPLPVEDALRRALTTAAVAWLFVVIAPVYALLSWAFESLPAFYYGLALGALVTAGSALLVLKRGFVRGAAWVLLGGGTSCVLLSFLREGSTTPAASNCVIPIVMAALLVGWRGVLAIGIPCGVLVALMHVAEERGLYHAMPRSSSGWVFTLMQIVSLTVMLALFDRILLSLLRARRELSQKLHEAQRLQAVGRLAGGVAHDFNNLLTVILANAALIDAATVPAEVREDLAAIRSAAERAAALTKQLLAFSRQQRLTPATFDLERLMDDVVAMLRRVIPESIRIERTRGESPLWLRADAGQVLQVLMNLAVNARDAMPDGGTLELSAGRATADLSALGLPPGPYLRLGVRDSGVGMDEVTRGRAFEPFFSMKSSGTGLGLATVHGIVSQSGGAIRVTSEPGAGAEFEVFLPAVGAPSTSLEPSDATDASSPPRGRTVLLVEDNELVRRASARILDAQGHAVIQCSGAEHARRAWAEHFARVDLILTDVVMADGNGPTLIRELLKERSVRVLFMSGYLDEALKDTLLARAPFIPKPFTAMELKAKLDAVLAGPPLAAENGDSPG